MITILSEIYRLVNRQSARLSNWRTRFSRPP